MKNSDTEYECSRKMRREREARCAGLMSELKIRPPKKLVAEHGSSVSLEI
jgi:hypothetical protein